MDTNLKTSSSSNEIENSSENVKTTLQELKEIFADCPDFVCRKIYLRDDTEGGLLYIDGLVDSKLVQSNFILPILDMELSDFQDEKKMNKIPTINLSVYRDIKSITKSVLSGSTVLVLNEIDYAIGCALVKVNSRSITEPIIEKNVRGSHDGFIENINTNISILRERIKNSNLKFKTNELGASTSQKVAIGYIEGIANPDILKKLYEKVNAIDYDGLIAIGYIQQTITDYKHSIFPQFRLSERPDVAEQALLDGRFIIMLDGTPGVLIAPVNFFYFYKAVDDYSSNWVAGSLIRAIRISGTFIALLLPAYYIALTSYHYYMIPVSMLIPLAISRAKVPFPPIIEALLMEFIIESLREASIRLPTYIAASIGIVGGIILGQAVVEAGIVSNLFIIVIAVTAITSYSIPTYDMEFAIRLARTIFMIMASIFGIVGIIAANSFLLIHLIILESLGQPYFQPVFPFKLKDFKDTIIRFPIRFLKNRLNESKPMDKIRGKKNDRKRK